MTADPYDILGITRDTPEDEIKKKYRALVKQYHPDLHPDDEEAARKMSEINEAYELIKSGEADRYNSYNTSAPSGTYTRNGESYTYQYIDPEEIFRTFFGAFGMGGFASSHSDEDPYDTIERFIQMGAYSNAAAVLNRIRYHDAKWNYYAAIVCMENYRFSEAVAYADAAVSMEPDNCDYKTLSEKAHEVYAVQLKSIKRKRNILTAAAVGFSALFLMQILSPLIRLFTM